jgi:hypothetical protein
MTASDDRQLIHTSEDSVIIIRDPSSLNNNEIKPQTKTDIQQQTFVLRLFSWPIHILTSLHIPHFTDRSLRITFLLFITLIGLTSFTIALIVGSSVVQFKHQCPLYASFKFESLKPIGNNWTLKITPSSEIYASQSICDFCTFYNVFTFIYCIMTGFFFVLFNGDHRIVTTNDRCLIIPW